MTTTDPMKGSEASRDDSWAEALGSAASILPPADPEAHVFYEEREDFRADLLNGEVQDVVHTRSRGLAAAASSRVYFRSDPIYEDAISLARDAMAIRSRHPVPARPAVDPGFTPRLDGAEPVRLLRQLSEEVTALRTPGALTVRAAWIGFRQAVLTARPGEPVRSDVRESSRVKLEVRIERGGRRAVAVRERVGRPGRVVATAGLADDVTRRALQRLDARPLPSGPHPVVFAAGVGGILVHEVVGHALEGDTVARGASALWVSGRGIARPELVVVDDPRRGRAPWRWDDEGGEAGATCLIRGGSVCNLVLDRRTAASLGRSSTGHGRRSSFQEPVLPRLGCTFLAPGSLGAGEVAGGVARGLLVHRMETAGTDPSSGVSFFQIADADLLMHGKCDVPLSPALLRVTSREVLQSLDRIGDDLEFDTCVGSCVRDGQPMVASVGAPTCRLGLATVFS